MTIDYLARLDNLLEGSGADLVAFVPGENMLYFTGLHFHLSRTPNTWLVQQARICRSSSPNWRWRSWKRARI